MCASNGFFFFFFVKQNIQDKDELRYSKEYVKKYQEDKSLTYIYYSN